ncbi:hypothetical protein AG1IA_06668 [Rhizoctonia solani AG-1 IA]|uniref:Uncharacterized protein n=1 Tax=Thanatephorus cucumeris (strain AG1-IA) TaxID=983506 RepID=L8WRA7_THACA|nr:hypothetical protein AG1IA_06668 [Rhizoctonia solani AG-1 IA]
MSLFASTYGYLLPVCPCSSHCLHVCHSVLISCCCCYCFGHPPTVLCFVSVSVSELGFNFFYFVDTTYSS